MHALREAAQLNAALAASHFHCACTQSCARSLTPPLTPLPPPPQYEASVLQRRVSALDLLAAFPSCRPTFAAFLDALPPLQPRLYSVSSSPLVDPRRVTITLSVVDGLARSGSGERFQGVASSYLAAAAVGTRIHAVMRPSAERFHPSDPAVEMVMIAAGRVPPPPLCSAVRP